MNQVSTYTARGQVTSHPHGITITLLLEAEHLLELVAESEVQGLSREVSDDVGSVATPQGHDTLISHGTLEAVGDAIVAAIKTTSLDHFILVLDQELDTLDGSSGGLRDGGRDTTHCETISICRYQVWDVFLFARDKHLAARL